MLSGSWRIGRIVGIDIRMDPSWLVIVLLITASFYLLFVENVSGLVPLGAAGLALLAALLFFGSLLAHELAHALIAKNRGLQVRSITLFLFGGMTDIRLSDAALAHELAITVVGPLTSGVIGLGFLAVGWATDPIVPESFTFMLWYLGWVNLLLAGFNLLPGFPLDGGRILRAIAYRVTGDLRRATRLAANGGRAVSLLLVAFGIAQALSGYLGGVWLVAIGWFLGRAAAITYAQAEAQEMLATLEVKDVMVPDPPLIPSSLTLDRAVRDYFLHYEDSQFAVVDDGEPVGVLTLEGVRAINQDNWASLTAAEATSSLEKCTVVEPDRSVQETMELLEVRGGEQAFVIDGGAVVATVSLRDIGRWLRRSREVGLGQQR